MASDGEDVAIEVFLDFWVGGVVGLAVEEGEVGGVDGESFFEDGEDAVFFDFPIEAFEDEALPVGTIAEFFEFFGLGGGEEAPEFFTIDGEGAIEVGGDSFFVAGVIEERSFDAVF